MADATTTTTTTTTTAPAATAGTAATSSTGEKNVVVFGGTGAQGSAFVRALSEYPGYKIFLLVRSEKPTPLKDLPGVTIVHSAEYGEHPALALRATHLKPGEVYGVFSVQGYIPEKQEITQGESSGDDWTTAVTRWRMSLIQEARHMTSGWLPNCAARGLPRDSGSCCGLVSWSHDAAPVARSESGEPDS